MTEGIIIALISGSLTLAGVLISNSRNQGIMGTRLDELTREVIKRFEDKYHTITCKDLLEQANLEVEIKGSPEERTKEYYQRRPCDVIVRDAAEILENFLIEKGIIIDNK